LKLLYVRRCAAAASSANVNATGNSSAKVNKQMENSKMNRLAKLPTPRSLARFLADTEEGKSIADRWQSAVDVVLADYTNKLTELERMTDRLQLSNALGRAHREAIKSCGP
jgi:hypothetical protein